MAIGAALDEGGRLWLAKVENQRLLVSWSDDGGRNFSNPVPATPEPENIVADGENRPKIAVARDGTVLLTWVQSLPQKYSGNVRFARSTDSGQTFSQPITLNDDGRITSHRFDSMAIDGMGRVVVAWLDARDRDAAKEKGESFSGVSIYTARSSDNGASFGANRRFQAHTCECCRIALTWTAEGPIAFWRNIFGSNTRDFAIGNLD
ncbi:MAG TPA: sialidase family protein, partial [Nitrosospira sp.]